MFIAPDRQTMDFALNPDETRFTHMTIVHISGQVVPAAGTATMRLLEGALLRRT